MRNKREKVRNSLAFNTDIFSGNFDDELWIFSNFPTLDASNISEQCVKDTRRQLTALRHGLPWATKMYESSGALTFKLIHTANGNVHHEAGLFDECLLSTDDRNDDDASFQGQYCTVFFDLKPPDVASLNNEAEPMKDMGNFAKSSVGFCIPSTCTARDLRTAVAQRVGVSLVSITSEDYCYTQDKIRKINSQFDTAATVTCLILVSLVLIVISASIHEAFWSRENHADSRWKPVLQVLNCFSAIRNGRALLSTESEHKDNLSCLYGLRFLAMNFIILFHSGHALVTNINNGEKTAKNADRWEAQLMVNASVFVEIFFLISGLLATLSLMRQLDRNGGSFNIIRFYIHRYIRITPLYATAIAFVSFLLPYMAIGPDWHYLKEVSDATRGMWWAQLLYINNYVPWIESSWDNPQIGMAETWYLACEMQMFWLSPLFIYPLWKWKKNGLVWVVCCLFAFLGASTIPFILYDLTPSLMTARPMENLSKISDYCHLFYHPTYTRISPYLIGILLGYLLHKTKDRGVVQINKYVLATGWVISTLLALSALFGLATYLNEGETSVINSFVRVLYGAFHRTGFALCFAWVVFACTHNYGGFVNRFLSWKVFMPLGRLCFAAYLINLNFIKVYTANMRTPVYFVESHFLVTCAGFITYIFTLSFLASVLIEMPFLNLDKMLLPNAPRVVQKEETGKVCKR